LIPRLIVLEHLMSEADDDLNEDHGHVVITIRDAEPRPIITVRLTSQLTGDSDKPASLRRESPARS
jgi:hypothetical protein